MTNIITLKSTPIIFSINPESLIELKQEQDMLIAKVPANIDQLDIELYKKAKRKVAKLRIETEKERKELKAAALSYGKLVDSTAENIQKPVAEIENVYDKLITEYDNYFVELASVVAKKEEKRIADIKDKIQRYRLLGDINVNLSSSELKSRLDEALQEYLTADFNFQEFSTEMKSVFETTENILKNALENRLKYESEQEELKKQQSIQAEVQAKFEAEKAAFEATQREANAKLELERAALQKQKDDAEMAEKERLFAEQKKQRLAEIQGQQIEIEKQRSIDQEKRRQLEIQEKERLEQIKIENENRRIAQEKEDRIRNAAPQLLNALELILQDMLNTAIKYEFINPKSIEISQSAIKLAKGE